MQRQMQVDSQSCEQMTYYFPVVTLPDEVENGQEEEKEEGVNDGDHDDVEVMMKSGTYNE